MPEAIDFADFFRAVHGGRDPLPWQERLATQVVAGSWPAEIGIPTGLGKTTCLDIAVWGLARTAGAGTGRAATRIWYVVNRRLLVDAAWEHGLHLAELLADPSRVDGRAREAVDFVAAGLTSLAALGSDGGPLHVARFRGGSELGVRAPDPSQPCLLFATVPMFASRWLFRGYGSSTSMRPVDAAHAGIDSLVLLDEAHLARPLLQLSERVRTCDTGDPSTVLAPGRSRPAFVALTATGEASGDRFELDDEDLQHPIVQQRLHAPKRGQLVESSRKTLVDDVAAAAVALVQEHGGTCLAFANTPATARAVRDEVARRLAKSNTCADVLLLTGRMREREAARIRSRLLEPRTGVKSGTERVAEHPLIVVATQTLEVGADVDFDHLVTESAGVRSLIQRLGRVNRLGTRPAAVCVVCHPLDVSSWPVYGHEPATVWAALQAGGDHSGVDLSAGSVSGLLGPPGDLPPRVGELLAAHLWEWAKTTTPPQGEAPVELFFEGFDTTGDVSVVWRAYRPADGERFLPAATADESVDVPVHALREALAERGRVRRLTADRVSLESVEVGEIRPGDVVVLAPSDGLYDEQGWNPEATEVVLDASALQSGRLMLSQELLENLAPGCGREIGPVLEALLLPDEEEGADDRALLDGLVATLRRCQPSPWIDDGEWEEFLDGLGRSVERPIDALASVAPVPSRRQATLGVRADALEELSFTASSRELEQHMGAVGEAAGRIAAALGLAAPLVEAAHRAGAWHDLGKLDPRFQRWLDPDGDAEMPLAKSGCSRDRIASGRVAAGWPLGGRHELLSARLAQAWFDQHDDDVDTDLVLHLVASHHGFGRPLVHVVHDPAPPRVAAAIEGTEVTVSGDLAIPEWGQPERFRAVCERYGLWGVALLEAIVRQADHAVSHASEVA